MVGFGVVAAFVLVALASVPGSATNVCSGSTCAAPLIESEDVPNNTVSDIYVFTGSAGTGYVLQADTKSAGTTFDPWMRICTDLLPTLPPKLIGLSGCFAFGDDNVPCTFPPPSFSCPRLAGTLPADLDGLYYVGVAAHPCCNGNLVGATGEYDLRVTLTPFPAVMATQLVLDDRTGNLP